MLDCSTEIPMTNGESSKSKVSAARLWGATKFPYLASALFATTVVFQPECKTISVDRQWRMHADPDLLETLSVNELGKLYVHLTGHVLREHAERASLMHVSADLSGEAWNRATDAEINDDLEKQSAIPAVAPELPKDLGCNDGQLAEAYLPHARDVRRRWDCGSGCDNVDRPWESSGTATANSEQGIGGEQARLVRLGVAAEMHKQAGLLPGSVPAGLLRWAESILPSRVDWRRVLAAEIRHGIASVAGNVDYTYRKPSRRANSAPNVVLPAMHRPVPDVAIVCDTSGSMSDELLARALSEVEGILAQGGLRSAQVRVLAVDTNVHAVKRVTTSRQVELAGGGGTDMGAGIRAAAALRPRPSVIVVLTDGFTPWPDRPPKATRVVVGILEQQLGVPGIPPPPWARSVQIELETASWR
jgi:predicted metal-dependent peptidase